MLLIWYSALSFLRSSCHNAGAAISHSAQSGLPPHVGALLLLILVLVCNGFAAAVCTALFKDAWNMLLLFACDCIILGNEATIHSIRYFVTNSEERHRELIAGIEEQIVTIRNTQGEIGQDDDTAVQSLEQNSRLANREMETQETYHAKRIAALDKLVFALELFCAFVLAAHYIHIWVMHGASFGLVDVILLLHIQSTLSSIGRKVCDKCVHVD